MVPETDAASDEGSRKGKRTRDVAEAPAEEKIIAAPVIIPVKVVRTEGAVALVEWGDHVRGTVPTGVVTVGAYGSPDGVAEKFLKAAIPYGEKWSQIEGMTEPLETLLREQGIYTAEDLLTKNVQARNCLQRALVIPLMQALIAHARKRKAAGR
jgi:hypothetical protein